MKSTKAVLYGKPCRCPCCGTEMQISATVRLKGREIGQDKIEDYPPVMPKEEDEDG